ncbi:hypothetical protein ROHU_028939 [Labeo rohita]|uniref:Uncharacterized protein n=1 Tax=Labeo rohita TaxID=84645 RepID=A0A498M3U9_LABRO|nr:hypothetical protein ROHU_010289 [Labeo rohita]RXN13814.1 hypothetical protein ROHU_028939 [Labeo rohita]
MTPVVPSSVVLEDPTLVVLDVTEQSTVFVLPMILALPAPPRLLALPAPIKLLALPAPPKLSALLTPFKLPAFLTPFKLPALAQESATDSAPVQEHSEFTESSEFTQEFAPVPPRQQRGL